MVDCRNDCGLANIGSDELALVYTLTNTSTLQIMLDGTEYPAIFLTAALLTQSCRQNTRSSMSPAYYYYLLSTLYCLGVCTRGEITSCSCTPPPRSVRGRD